MVLTRAWVHKGFLQCAPRHVSARQLCQADDPARDVASAAAGDAVGSMSEHSHVPLGPWHGRWGDGRQPPSAERSTAESA
jgi:hypothetical protein